MDKVIKRYFILKKMKKGHWKIPMYKELAYVKTDLKIIKLNCEIVQDRKKEMQSFVGDHRYPPDK